MGKLHGFRGSIGKSITFTIKYFHFDNRALKMVSHRPLGHSCDLLSTLGKVSGIMPPSQNYGIRGSNAPDKINIEHNIEMAHGPLFHLLCMQL